MKFLMMCFFMFNVTPQDTIVDLDHVKWKNRLVLYFPKENEKDYDFPDSVLMEIEERKIVYLIIEEDIKSNRIIDFPEMYKTKISTKYRMGSKNDCWVLIGLDGGVKLKKETRLDWDLIFKTIDAMPMRNSEIKKIHLK